MAVLDPDAPPHKHMTVQHVTETRQHQSKQDQSSHPVRVEPLLDLEWSRAVEPTGPIDAAREPSQTRRSWLHRAPENQVVGLYNAVRSVVDEFSAPWWLRALAAGTLSSRIGGFAVEDQVTRVLQNRPGWLYMPWTDPGEDGYWEYLPTDLEPDVELVPTTIVFTDHHFGWLDVIPAHTDGPGAPVPIAGATDLRARIETLERR